MRILIVDDIPDNLRVLSSMLTDEGLDISTATNGQRALRIARNYPPDLILLDIMMPGMDGYEVLAALRDIPGLRDVPVIFVTALADTENEIRGLELGAVDFITKPFSEAVVRLRVRTQLELKRQRDILGRLSYLDGLTGVSNRRAFDERLDVEWRRASRFGQSLGLLIVDVDFFKSYNDLYGHLAGDECLRRIAAALDALVPRAGDCFARFGGEEFAALLYAVDSRSLQHIAEDLRRAVESLHICHGGSRVSPWVTVSIGGGLFRPGRDADPTILIGRADRQLYAAKEGGRNRVSLEKEDAEAASEAPTPVI
jgi:diguanylate cyclase (GGDEF)-like protein